MKYFLSIVTISSFALYITLLLLRKYAALTFEHFVDTCARITINFFSTGAHYAGFILSFFVLATTLGLFLKTLFSYIKTKIKLNELLQKRLLALPKKLKTVLIRQKINEELIIVVRNNDVYAFTIGWFSPKIVISANTVKKLNKRQLEAVVLHELYHLKHKHPLLLVIGEILSSSLRLLPILQDLIRNLRSTAEQEADVYVINRQRTARHLNLALDLAVSENKFEIYPNFSRRKDRNFRKSSIFVFFLFILFAIFLFKLPPDIHANEPLGDTNKSHCVENICNIHCPGDNNLRSSKAIGEFQTALTSSRNPD